MSKQCDNCGSEEGPFHSVHWESVEEWETYCDECYRKEIDPPDFDEPEELPEQPGVFPNNILQL